MPEEQSQEKPELNLDRPADRSLEAYKNFINEMFGAVAGDQSDELTEEEWVKAWRDFWQD